MSDQTKQQQTTYYGPLPWMPDATGLGSGITVCRGSWLPWRGTKYVEPFMVIERDANPYWSFRCGISFCGQPFMGLATPLFSVAAWFWGFTVGMLPRNRRLRFFRGTDLYRWRLRGGSS